MRLGFYGGSFDPIHVGHVAVADAARRAHRLDRVLVVPAACPPHKRRVLAPAEDRLAMARLATVEHEGLVASDIEVRRGGVSYTVESLDELAKEHPDAELFLIVGADSLGELPSWRALGRIVELARVVVVDRPGFDGLPSDAELGPTLASLRQRLVRDRVEMEPCPVSSTEVREALRFGRSLEGSLEPAVARYIAERGLYGPART